MISKEKCKVVRGTVLPQTTYKYYCPFFGGGGGVAPRYITLYARLLKNIVIDVRFVLY